MQEEIVCWSFLEVKVDIVVVLTFTNRGTKGPFNFYGVGGGLWGVSFANNIV